jgi:RNA polymerase sigma-70 factor, ECF subfamily
MKTAGEITALLNEVGAGNREAFDSVFALVYDELRRMASSCMRQERKDHTLQTTALVNEAYMKLVGGGGPQWRTRLHFFAVAATVMRHILVDYARARSTARRGGNAVRVALDEAAIVSPERADEVVAVNAALDELALLDGRQARVVELRYFGGLTLAEAAEVLGVSSDTVTRDWNSAKAFLYQRINA